MMTKSNTAIKQLESFVQQGKIHTRLPPIWIADEEIEVYVRKGYHRLNKNGVSTTLDIANVQVLEEKRGQGIFTEFLRNAISINPWDAVYVECIHNERLLGHLLKEGWTLVENSQPPSVFLIKNDRPTQSAVSRTAP